MTNPNHKLVSLVLSSGAARGLAHIGVIEILQEHGYSIRSIAGSSIGAVIGGIFAAGKLNEYKEWICSLKAIDVFRLLDFTIPSRGMIKGVKVFDAMQHFLKDVNIEDLPIPFTAVGTDLRRKKEIVFKNGSLYNAMRASVSVPGILTPFVIEGREVVDGGVLSPLPIDFLERVPGSKLVVSNVNAQIKAPEKAVEKQSRTKAWIEKLWNPTGVTVKLSNDKLKLFDIYQDSISLMGHKMTQLTIEKHKPDLAINISEDLCGMFEFHLAKELIQHGRDHCQNVIDNMEP